MIREKKTVAMCVASPKCYRGCVCVPKMNNFFLNQQQKKKNWHKSRKSGGGGSREIWGESQYLSQQMIQYSFLFFQQLNRMVFRRIKNLKKNWIQTKKKKTKQNKQNKMLFCFFCLFFSLPTSPDGTDTGQIDNDTIIVTQLTKENSSSQNNIAVIFDFFLNFNKISHP